MVSAIAAILVTTVASFAATTYTTYQRTKRYIVPGTERDKHPKTAGLGLFDILTLRSVRTRGGKRWGDNELAINCEVMAQAIADGLQFLEIVITYTTKNITVTYATDFETMQKYGRQVVGVSGPEWSLPLCYWSINGQPAIGPAPEPQPVAEQPALFAFDEPRRARGY
ncbi:MAG: hypothetical protein KDE53_38175 [Caldilineaceae bacterium]|nr:hypothetical protein [Caldilineaceae bacterium]